ncbi:hypothetical protein [Tateyamaria sp. SN6-1]|uniref:hypothetical protein n=1 Tax=Tateyamaria sp. SN6-1 TaxID=3092148 RepID=UPI0039F621DE
MVWRDDNAPGQRQSSASRFGKMAANSSAKITVLLVVMGFLMVTIVLVAMQPRPQPAPTITAEIAPAPQPVAAPAPVVAEPVVAAIVAPAPTPAPPQPDPVVQQVSRADASLLELREAVRSTQASDVLRQLSTEGASGPSDLPRLARNVLSGFGYAVQEGDRLHALLVGALSNQKSDAYIDALLNTAAARGEFTPPFALILPTGRMDTGILLDAMVRGARG